MFVYFLIQGEFLVEVDGDQYQCKGDQLVKLVVVLVLVFYLLIGDF